MSRSSVLLRYICFALLLAAIPARAEDKWKTPTPEELSMSLQHLAPTGADAMYLDREEIDEDEHDTTHTVYSRIKVLAPKGTDYAKIVLNYSALKNGLGTDILMFEGRTIDPDGSVRPMTAPYSEQVLNSTPEGKVGARTYTLPWPSMGSIFEYRYKMHYRSSIQG